MRTSLRPLFPPAAIIIAATLAVWLGPPLPPTLAGLKSAGPLVVLGAGMAIAGWYNRGRAFFILASLLAAYAGYQYSLTLGGFSKKAVYTALVVLVPLNALLALLRAERGVRYHGAHRWLLLLLAEALLVAWIASAGRSMLAGTAWHDIFQHWLLRSPPTPLVGRLAFAAAFIAAAWRAWPDHTPLEIGIAGALAAFFIAAEWAGSSSVFGAFLTAAGAILMVALLQESHRLAFRDELTGLPGRRALEESLRALGPRYAIAMVDVDHFKKFNDTHGHDVGDQVLKLVAARLAKAGGGGRAFRYGGEEFCLLFRDADPAHARPHVDALRASIAAYEMAIRGEDRPKQEDQGIRRRAGQHATKTLSVTVSMGLAGPAPEHARPSQVLKAADEALYRAKKAGRNRVAT